MPYLLIHGNNNTGFYHLDIRICPMNTGTYLVLARFLFNEVPFRIPMIYFSLNSVHFMVSSPGLLLLENTLSTWSVVQAMGHGPLRVEPAVGRVLFCSQVAK